MKLNEKGGNLKTMADKKTTKPVGASNSRDTDKIFLDFTGVKPLQPLPETTDDGQTAYYLCQVINANPGRSKKGERKLSVTFEVLEPEENKNFKLFREYSFVEKALPFLYQLYKAVDPDMELGASFEVNPADLLGQQVAVTVRNEEFEEQIRSRVQKVWPASKYQG